MIYESRVYTTLPGRMPALLARFENVTLGFWEKYGIRQVAFFTTVIGESSQDLSYLLAWESMAEREQKWTAFQSDPEWVAARAASEADGQIVANIASSFLTPTKFSALR
ncbi:NIPSNAP family protein [Lysinimonas soli]|uniref:NIPSNAP family protein n=1 Tax=Lysinimonas soli TaxID=1074233 RepID=A0ABW0NQH7_9MICO